ncbi:MAG TPA: hypothetical protein VMV69_24500 [Pirellulales bacterium]|nr:hypothetical protein [Pirellulales bacterium]
MDKDRFSFDLRGIGGKAVSRTFVFDKSLLADVLDTLHADDLVTVVGIPDLTRRLVRAVAIRRISTAS